mgnify:CR=1 FL=1
MLMSQYHWERRYCIWELSFACGIRHIASIAGRLNGKNVVEEHFKSQMLEALAAWQNEFNCRHGLIPGKQQERK